MQLLFCDTETTGLDEHDRLIQVAYKLFGPKDEMVVEYFRPPVPISYKSMSIHHITHEMCIDKPSFEESEAKKFLLDIAPRVVFVAHNAPFDLNMLSKEGVRFPLWIDTYRCALHLLPDSEEHNLQYLRYTLGLNVAGKAHDAEGDVNVLIALFERLLGTLLEKEKISSEEGIHRMVTMSVLPVLLKTCFFKKHYNRPWEEVVKIDRQYAAWLYSEEMNKPAGKQNDDLIYTLKTYL